LLVCPMNVARREAAWVSAEQYLASELESSEKHEYVAGAVYAMSGASDIHNVIAGNIFAYLHGLLRGKPCRPFMADMKLKIRAATEESYFYPDVMVACDPTDNATYWRERPSIIFEVLSPSTSRVDRDKFFIYQGIAALQFYALVEQSEVAVHVFSRAVNGWRSERLTDPGSALPLGPLGGLLPLATIYDETDL
nr:Uma2 family endonuclease [Verrucomicrobiota bacterium]